MLDVLYFHAGYIRKTDRPYDTEPWSISGYLPDYLPPAHQYGLVFRFDRQQVPDLEAVSALASEVSRLGRVT